MRTISSDRGSRPVGPRLGDDCRDAPKRDLAIKVNRIIDARGLSQAGAGNVLGMPQSKVSGIRNYKLRGISMERLIRALADLGQHVEIVVVPSTERIPAGVKVPA